MSTQAAVIDNGVNVEALLGAREALSQAPAAAQFKWRATSEWVSGTHTKSVIKKFFGLGEEQPRIPRNEARARLAPDEDQIDPLVRSAAIALVEVGLGDRRMQALVPAEAMRAAD